MSLNSIGMRSPSFLELFRPTITGFWTTSPTSGAYPKLHGVLSTCMLFTTIAATVALLIVNIYVPSLRLSNPIFNPVITAILLSIHGFLLAMTLWSLICVKTTNPGYIPRPHKLVRSEVRAIEGDRLEYAALTQHESLSREFILCDKDGNPERCDTCKTFTPARTSHCTELGRCVKKFDHFCPLVFYAIGVGNYRYFIQLLCWAMALATYLQIVAFVTVRQVGSGGWLIGLGRLASFFADIMIPPLLALHLNLIFDNVTTGEDVGLEIAYTPRLENGKCIPVVPSSRSQKFVRCNVEGYFLRYSRCLPHCKFVVVTLDINSKPWQLDSKCGNWCRVMGTNWWEWILPVSLKRMERECGTRKWWEFEFNERTKKELRRKANKKLAEMKIVIYPVLVMGLSKGCK